MITGRKVLAIIPARGGSKGLPDKNILPAGGKPLIQWTLDAARASRYIDRLILSSDDDAIMNAAKAGGCEVPFRRAAHLANDTASSVDVVLDALARVPGYHILVLLQPTSPLRTGADIDGTLEQMVASAAPVCVSLRPVDDHPYYTFRLGAGGQMERYAIPQQGGMPSRRQDLPEAWCLNGAVYAADTGWFVEKKTFLTCATVGYCMPYDRSLDIDTFEDMEHLRQLLEKRDARSPVNG